MTAYTFKRKNALAKRPRASISACSRCAALNLPILVLYVCIVLNHSRGPAHACKKSTGADVNVGSTENLEQLPP